MGARDVSHFDRFAGLFDRLMPPADPDALRAGFDRATRPVDRVLDVGGGTGRAIRRVEADAGIVLDPAMGMLRRAQTHGLTGVAADGARLPVEADSVDAVVVSDALHHVGNRTGLLAETARVLRPGGVLIVRDFDPTTIRGRLLAAGEHLVGFESEFWTASALAEAMAETGFHPTVVDGGFAYTVIGMVPDPPADTATNDTPLS